MHFYQINVVIKQYKEYEFVKSVQSFSRKIRKEKACVDCIVYRDSEKENTFSLVGKWKTHQAMETHFNSQNFKVLVGAARVLAETFEINIAEVLKTGGFELIDQILSQQKLSVAGIDHLVVKE